MIAYITLILWASITLISAIENDNPINTLVFFLIFIIILISVISN